MTDSDTTLRKPDFIIAGTQKGGTTWLEHNLSLSDFVFTPRRQLHFFDQHFDKGIEWYCSNFQDIPSDTICGEKTTEYFDPRNVDKVFSRIKEHFPDTKIIVILREPSGRARSALAHVVRSGLMSVPKDVDAAIQKDIDAVSESEFRFTQRGFYIDQLTVMEKYVPKDQICVLIFEEDIVGNPIQGFRKVCEFLGIEPHDSSNLDRPINRLRLSRLGLYTSRLFYNVPYARGAIRVLDKFLGLKKWEPEFSKATRDQLDASYATKNQELYEYLGRKIPSWERSKS